uniref:Type I restriction enzyme, R subunit n=1 Tax=Candidatus Kentrum eta TaxID=2126337 RepID=A0A450U6Y4_9GAMM|nr:MAG: type I restriction enzyme, R subunit [Candidatus Kentron sp. H]VFJ89054.1 MAG: type I restriction enzyme, R subunit [Candidatus Kentron sp. H]VFJ95748.1 MAG: type I restriction enzyme, R subunit [Candidatus Kentron sp. H]
MATKEAGARIKIDELLKEAGWRFFDDPHGRANVALERNVKLTETTIDALGKNFEKTKNGFVDFLLTDDRGFPLIVLEAKAEDKSPLVGKEQARRYAQSQNCRFVILSNGNLHYFWDLERGNPRIITRLPGPGSIEDRQRLAPEPRRLISENIAADYVALTQMPGYAQEAGWKRAEERPGFIEKNKLRFLRDYQQRAVRSIQTAVAEGKDRFLLEMATGTGKTLVASAVIKLFLRAGNARRVLFLVDRLELETQAEKQFDTLLKNDYTTVIYKQNRDDWRKAEIVVTTVQSLLFNEKYRRLFSPTDFDLVISDEAHRSIGGNARAVFEYFVGYKLGLTATPKDYLKRFDATASSTGDPRELERRELLDTYRAFGCESGEPTFRYALLDGVRDGFLINPIVVDARTDITTQLLSEQGYQALTFTEGEEDIEQNFRQKDFEKKFFSEATNRVLCETLLKHALTDPISGEMGKTIVFAVSQKHAGKLTQILNELADSLFPGKYQSDFAVQVTSLVSDAQQFTIGFANNNLLGAENFLEGYKTGKARVCVTVGMMTTGYDCPDILNLALMRPIFSAQGFIQIKGRGTRRHDFSEQLSDPKLKKQYGHPNHKQEKTAFKLFDFFANCEYFEEKFDYDQVLQLPKPWQWNGDGDPWQVGSPISVYGHTGPDEIVSIAEDPIGPEGMKIDRMFFQRFEDKAREDNALKALIEGERWDLAIGYVKKELFEKPEEYFNLEKLRRALGIDRRLDLREILEKVFGFIPYFKSKDELLDDEFRGFLLDRPPEELERHAGAIAALEYFFKAYAGDGELRKLIDDKRFDELHTNPAFDMADLDAVPSAWRQRIPEYIGRYVPLERFE